MSDPTIRPAFKTELATLHALIERAYRGDAARAGWTHEADLLKGQRTNLAELQAIAADRSRQLLVAERDGIAIGCVVVADQGDGLGYFGQLCVEPGLQAAGLGKQLILAAEAYARDIFAAQRMEMTVIDSRAELIAFYERRGYRLTGERRDFPLPVERTIMLAVLAKPLTELAAD